jgi:hypothetical protein
MAVTTLNARRPTRLAPAPIQSFAGGPSQRTSETGHIRASASRPFANRVRRLRSKTITISARIAKEALRVSLVLAAIVVVMVAQAAIYAYLWRLPL